MRICVFLETGRGHVLAPLSNPMKARLMLHEISPLFRAEREMDFKDWLRLAIFIGIPAALYVMAGGGAEGYYRGPRSWRPGSLNPTCPTHPLRFRKPHGLHASPHLGPR